MGFILNKRLSKSIEEYCSTNSLDINEYLNDLIEKAHFSFVYGEQPSIVKQPKPATEQPNEELTPSREPILETEKTNVDLTPIPPKQPVYEPQIHTRGIQVVPMNNKPKIRRLS
jgi:hypothetical protein